MSLSARHAGRIRRNAHDRLRRPAWRQLLASGPGRVGVVLLVLLALVAIAVVVAFSADFGRARWSNPAYWADNPQAAPPAWVNLLGGDHVPHQVRETTTPSVVDSSGETQVLRYRLAFDHDTAEPPSFLSVSIGDVAFAERAPSLTVALHRPDNAEVVLYRAVLSSRAGGEPPHRIHAREPLRIVLSEEPQATSGAADLVRSRYDLDLPGDRIDEHLEAILFGRLAANGRVEPLPGTYVVEVRLITHDAGDGAGLVRAVAGGTAFGLMGTDGLGRDLVQGLLFGLPVALLIGVATSLVSTAIGASLGLVSGYRGGWVDTAIQRVADIVVNVPVLPLLIFLVFVFDARLWLILTVLVAFSWPGLTITVRAMVLQLRASPEVEATIALGASRTRIMARHIFPHLAPFVFAQLIFFAPAAILAEAGLSFLGLGDPSLPTWGQILEAGFRSGAVFLGYWWWVIPPGLLIVVTAVTFMLLSLGMESVADPRLRKIRS